jgi:hypothetical protein
MAGAAQWLPEAAIDTVSRHAKGNDIALQLTSGLPLFQTLIHLIERRQPDSFCWALLLTKGTWYCANPCSNTPTFVSFNLTKSLLELMNSEGLE